MNYYRQETDHSCGAACARMIMSHYGIEEPELFFYNLLNTTPTSGTDYSEFKTLAIKYNLIFEVGQDKSRAALDMLNEKVKEGHLVLLAYSLDVPHYSIFLGHNNNHLFLADPWRGNNTSEQIRKFLRKWKVDPKDFRAVIEEFGYEFGKEKTTYGWYMIFKQKK